MHQVSVLSLEKQAHGARQPAWNTMFLAYDLRQVTSPSLSTQSVDPKPLLSFTVSHSLLIRKNKEKVSDNILEKHKKPCVLCCLVASRTQWYMVNVPGIQFSQNSWGSESNVNNQKKILKLGKLRTKIQKSPSKCVHADFTLPSDMFARKNIELMIFMKIPQQFKSSLFSNSLVLGFVCLFSQRHLLLLYVNFA